MPDGSQRNNPPSWDLSRRCLDPLVNLEEEDDKIVVTADLPCVDKDDISVRVKEKELVLKAKMRREMRFKSWGGAHRKISFNSFRKEISLPVPIDPDRAEANFRNGILKIEMKKKEAGGSETDIVVK